MARWRPAPASIWQLDRSLTYVPCSESCDCVGAARSQEFTVGRSYIYGLALAGQEGVESVIKTILGDFELTLGLSGHKTIADIHGKAGEVTIKVTD